MKYLPLTTVVVISLLSTTSSFGQVKALINGVATDVDHINGELTAIYKQFPNYMNDFEDAPFDIFQKVPPRLNQEGFVEVEQTTSSLESTVTPSKEMVKGDGKKAKENNAIFFIGSTSDMNKKSVTKIKSFSDKITKGDSKSVLLKAWYKLDDPKSEELVKSRLDVCKAEMEANGVPSNLILTSILGSSKESRFVTVLLQ